MFLGQTFRWATLSKEMKKPISDYFPISIAIFMLSYMVANYLPVSQRTVSNIYYVGVALPSLVWLLLDVATLPRFLKLFSIPLLSLTTLTLLNIESVVELKPLLYMISLLACCAIVERVPGGVRRLYTIFAIISVLFFAWVFVDWIVIYRKTGSLLRYHEIAGVWLNPIYLALLISNAMVFLWLFHVEDWALRRSRLVLNVGFVILVLCVLLCAIVFQARTTLLGFSLFAATYIILRRMWAAGLAAMVLSAAAVWFGGIDEVLAKRGLSYRPEIWRDAWNHINSQCELLLGCGSDDYLFLGQYTQPHNTYFGVMYTDGLIGLLMIIWMLAVLLWHGLKVRSPWIMLSLIGIGGLVTVSGSLLTSPKPYWIYFWIPLLMVAMERKAVDVATYYDLRDRGR